MTAAKSAAAKHAAAAKNADPDVAPDEEQETISDENDNPGPEVEGGNGNVTNKTRGEEVADRTTDTDEDSTSTYRKEFLVGGPYHEDEEFTDEFHEANAASLAESAIHAGLRIVGDIVFVGAEPSGQWGHAVDAKGEPYQRSTLVAYEAPAVPAHLVGAGPTEELSDVAATNDDVVTPRGVLTDGDSTVPEDVDDDGEPEGEAE